MIAFALNGSASMCVSVLSGSFDETFCGSGTEQSERHTASNPR